MTDDRSSRVLFQLTGSVSAYKACHAVSRLTQAGCEVQTVATPAALRFVGAATLEGLSGRPVATDTFEPGRMMDHIYLARWADVLVLCPATANTVNRLAAGIADDLVGAIFLAHDFTKPYVLAPAMNTAMYDHPATSASLARLREWGVELIDPDAGTLACGEIGAGRLAEPDSLVAAVLRRLATTAVAQPEPRLKIAITAGGTKVPIDSVRAITNTSSGTTGAALADQFAARGHDVTLIHAVDAVLPQGTATISLVPYTTFDDLAAALRDTLPGGGFDAVVHLAAVSDFGIGAVEVAGAELDTQAVGKLASDADVTIRLTRNPKLLDSLRGLAGDAATIVGFKLTGGADDDERAAAVSKLTPVTDLVVHNDLTEIGDGVHPATIYRGTDPVVTVADNTELAAALEQTIIAAAARPA